MEKTDLSFQLQGTETTEQAGRNIAHAYERLHLQHPGLSHNELLRKILGERKEMMSRVSPNAVSRLIDLQESLLSQPNVALGELALRVTLVVADASEASLEQEAVSIIKKS